MADKVTAGLAVTIRRTDSADSAEAIRAVAEHPALGESMERLLSELVERLQRAHRERLVSVVLYGSGVDPQSRDSLSDYNVLCVLREITPEVLGASQPAFRWWREMKNPSPVLLTVDELRTSTDAFPIEFHDIRDRHRVLFGEDVVAGLAVDDTFYRAQVEHELRAKLVRLRQKAGGILSERDLLLRLMCDSVSTFCVLFRHALRLAGEAPMFGKHDVVRTVQTRWGVSPDPFETILGLREGSRKPKDVQDSIELFRAYLTQIQVVVDAVNGLAK
jgi:hypothetical protein